MRRITDTSEYRKVYQNPKRMSRRFFTVLFQYSEEENLPAIGITVSKKVGNAVVRNRVKRRIKAMLRIINFDIKSNFKGVIIAKPTATSASWNELKKELSKLLLSI